MNNWEILLVLALAVLAQAFNIDLANNSIILLLLLLALAGTNSNCCCNRNRLNSQFI